jgi:murein peptide amidase A
LQTYDELTAAWRSLRTLGVRVREVACVNAPRTLLVAEAGDSHAPCISISAGVHGDEPAAPWALLSIVRDGLLDPRFSYRIWPCLNPSGYVARTRENAEGKDVNRSFSRGGTTPEARAVITSNRDRRFELALDLHEDFEAEGSYLYEPLRPGAEPRFAGRVVDALDRAGLPVQVIGADFDLGTPSGEIPPYRLERGAVLVDADAELRLFTGLPSSLFYYRRGSQPLTFESPRTRPWDERIAAHRVFVTTVLAAFDR